MNTANLSVGQKIWLQSGDLLKEATVIEIAKHHMDVETVGMDVDGEEEEGRRNLLRFRINGKPGTIFEKLNNKQCIAGLDCWPEGTVTEFGPWELTGCKQ